MFIFVAIYNVKGVYVMYIDKFQYFQSTVPHSER